ncbi:hypothetical protein HN807_01855 [Candidatus Bathyarchaeota archaeon]|jgi:uncharacterized protein|nr:hypothetical protein [Candidatus Bathyarchaeota archaeon]MBT4320169.1 hypothetical protein [Candidatus Bathyarchaeota archaeon]MBT4424812.1 hypothetical protein [Candidatus Bathyarchaeota archaeon]MBT6605170.1 hypothetical protein [Candidatus Bathyarchaeota archaeon]MBT7186042.1 hypothetical protein [Candidatus Bathyarchaeota archaeon]
MESRGTLYLNPNEDNTEATIKAAKDRATELGLDYVVVASSSGSSGVKVAEAFKDTGVKVVVVTLFATSSSKPNPEHLAKIKELGGEVVTSSHALMGVPESLAKIKQGYVTPNTMIREVLRRFSQGTNVVADIVMMACDNGVIPQGVEVMAIAGMGNNADTAWILRACGSFNFFDKINGMEFRELVALPRTKKFW